jgi:small subunit ribosomal protein S8
MFSNIKNAQLSRKAVIFCKKNKFCENFLKLLWDQGYIIGYKLKNKKELKIFLKYKKTKPVIYSLRTLSKPSYRIYYSVKQIWKINSGKSLIIFSTSEGLQTLLLCKKKNVGGELLLILN